VTHPAETPPLAPIRLLDLDLDRPAGVLENLHGFVAVEALVRRNGDPVGWVRLPVVGGRCSADAIQGAFDPIGRPAAAGFGKRAEPATPLSVTVAVCTRDRTEDLARCLDSLEGVQYSDWEVLVVDNAPSSDATRTLVERRGARVRYTREPRPGLDWARNRAIAEAAGEIVAFTDDDVVVDPQWVRAIAAAFAGDPSVAAVTGLVLPAELDTEAQVLFERYRSFGRGFVPRRVARENGGPLAHRYGAAGDYGTGANMAFRRAVFDRIGPFDPALDVGTPSRGGGDLEMFFRVLKEGHALVYEPRAMVRHRHRRTLEELRGQIADHGISFSAYIVRSMLAYPDERLAFARLACWWYAKTAFRVLVPKAAPAGQLRALGLAELRGCLIGLGRYPAARRAANRLVGEPHQSETRT
jgi:glycosyltransferase involved in cell wall biosynthesis